MSRNNHWFDPGKQHGARSSERRDERGDSWGGSSDGYNDWRYDRGGQQQYDDQWQRGGKRDRDGNSGREPRCQYGGQGGGMQQRERDRGYDHVSGSGSGVPRHEYYGNGGSGGGGRGYDCGYDGGWQQDHDEEWRHNIYTHDGRGGGSGRRHGDLGYEYRGNGGGVSFSTANQLA